jgi:hypothetical protein
LFFFFCRETAGLTVEEAALVYDSAVMRKRRGDMEAAVKGDAQGEQDEYTGGKEDEYTGGKEGLAHLEGKRV